MPIGKNAIKRASNSKSTAVQENSKAINEKVEEAPKVEEVKTEKSSATEVKKAPKKATKKKTAPKKSMETEPELSPVETAKKVTKKAKPVSGEHSFVAIGEEMPIFLL